MENHHPIASRARNRAARLKCAGLLLACSFLANPAFPNLNRKRNLAGLVYWHGTETGNKVALTFDDGPNEPYTSQILKILKDMNVKATFFVLGRNVERYPDAARAIVEDGHAIGNHSYTHPDMLFRTNGHVRSQLKRTERVILQTTGHRPFLFRPPFGAAHGMTYKQSRLLGYVCVQWTISSKDWERPGTPGIVKNVVDHVHPGAIVLLHDGDKIRVRGDRSQTVAALPIIINELRRRGFELVTVPELLQLKRNDPYSTGDFVGFEPNPHDCAEHELIYAFQPRNAAGWDKSPAKGFHPEPTRLFIGRTGKR